MVEIRVETEADSEEPFVPSVKWRHPAVQEMLKTLFHSEANHFGKLREVVIGPTGMKAIYDKPKEDDGGDS